MREINKVLWRIVALFIGTLSIYAQTIIVQASKTIGKEFSPQNIVDGDLSTKWIADEKTGAWAIIDLGKEIQISDVWVYFDSRWPKEYDVFYSKDKGSWTSVYSIGAKKSINIFKIVQPITLKEKVMARYLKIDCRNAATERARGLLPSPNFHLPTLKTHHPTPNF